VEVKDAVKNLKNNNREQRKYLNKFYIFYYI